MSEISWKAQLAKAAKAFAQTIVAMTDEELLELSAAKDRVTRTNCWFVSYDVAKIASFIAANELQLRAERESA